MQSRKKIGYNISTFFIQMNLFTQRSKTFAIKLRQNECHGQHCRPLDFMITEREIRKAAEKLKNNKSPFSDKIRNEMIKASIDTLMPVYEKLFNSILNQGTMPQTWCGGHNSSCSIKIAQKQTRSFRYARGVRQGCILSPLLLIFILTTYLSHLKIHYLILWFCQTVQN